MKSKKIIVAALVAVAAIVLAGCSPRSSMATLSTDSDSETAEVFSLAKVLNLGTNYLTSLDYDNAILQYIDIIQHDPTNKEAYAGLYAAYAAQGKADEANKVFEQAQEVFDDEADFLPGFLDDAKLVFESGGGNVPFQMLSEHFWNDLNSVFAKDVGEAWIAADPQNADPYALLGAHYAALDDEIGIEKLLQNAETNGVDFNTIDTNTNRSFAIYNNTEVVIGKGSQANIIVSNPIISRAHAKISCRNGVCTIQDLGSKNGTFVGDEKILGSNTVTLANGMYITLGNEIFQFKN